MRRGPMRRGTIFGFAPYPRGETFVFEPSAEIRASFALGNFYSGGKSAFADTSTRTPSRTSTTA